MSKGHNWTVDWWSLGVFIYEIMIGNTPFSAPSPMEMYKKIIREEYEFPKGFNQKAKSLISHLL